MSAATDPVMYDASAFAQDANGRELQRGARVEILASGERGRVRDVDGNYIVVVEESGFATRLAARDVRAFEGAMMGAEKMDLTEVEVGADGSVEVCVDPSGDEAREGVLAYERSAACPYCSKSVALFDRKLGDHRVPGGVCDGSRREVARVEMGRAVLAC